MYKYKKSITATIKGGRTHEYQAGSVLSGWQFWDIDLGNYRIENERDIEWLKIALGRAATLTVYHEMKDKIEEWLGHPLINE